MKSGRIAFLGTSRSGLGHLRRIATIARDLRALEAGARPYLITNAPPDGLSARDRAVFEGVAVCERSEMSGLLAAGRFDMAVLDTLRLPGIAAFPGPAVLILRETPDRLLPGFRREDGKPWDRVIVPNPPEHWLPDPGPGFALSIAAAGWVVRKTGARRADETPAGIVVATGGGGNPETRAGLYPMLDRIIADARRRAKTAFVVRQALGPRSAGAALAGADELFDPGAALNAVFRAADLVISTAGYNSVLELASTDTPALLAAIPRSLDDQGARVRLWGARLGHGLDPLMPEAAVAWLTGQIDQPRRRAPVALGTDGAKRAAGLLLDLLCPVS